MNPPPSPIIPERKPPKSPMQQRIGRWTFFCDFLSVITGPNLKGLAILERRLSFLISLNSKLTFDKSKKSTFRGGDSSSEYDSLDELLGSEDMSTSSEY